MKKNLIRIFIFILVMFCPMYVDALGISASSTSITNGGSVRVTINASGLTGKFSVTSSNSNVLSGGTSSEWIENGYKTYVFNSRGIGTATITVTALDVSDSSGNTWSGSKSITIKVVKPRERSTNNNLRSLSIDGQEISPSFDKNTLEYTATVGDEIEKIKINAVMEDGYGHTEGAGEKELAEGINKFEIKAISETGKEKVYTLTVTVVDNNPINKTVDGKTYSLVKRASSLVLPDALDKEKFEASKITIDEVEIPAYVSEELNLTFVGLKDENGAIYLFSVVDGKIDKKYEILTSSVLNIEFMDAKDIPKNYTKTTIKISEKEYTVYQDNNKDYALIYGKNIDTDDEGWYVYSKKDNTVQKYNSDKDKEISKLNKKLKEEKEKNNILLIIIAGISALSFIIILIEMIFNGKMRRTLKKINLNDDKKVGTLTVVEEKKEEPVIVKEEKKPKKEKTPKKAKKEEAQEAIIEESTKEIAEKVEVPKEEETNKKAKKKGKTKTEKEVNKEDEIPTLEEITEDLKPVENTKVIDEEEEALREMEEFYGKVRKSKRNRL